MTSYVIRPIMKSGMAFLTPVFEHPAIFTSGERYHGNTPVDFKITNGTVFFDFNFGAYHVPIVTESLCDKIISKAGDENLQKVPITIKGSTSSDFFILNVINMVPCFDFEKSKYTTWDELEGPVRKSRSLRMVIDLKVRAECLSGVDIARVAEWPVAVIVAGKMSRVLAEASGVELELAE